MNDILAQVLKIAPTYVLIGLVFVWIVVKALADTAQFFGDFLPQRRRLSRTRAALESIKAKAEAVEIAQKLNLQLKSNLSDAIKEDIETLLGGPVRRSTLPTGGGVRDTVIEVLYSLVVSIAALLCMLGAVFNIQNFAWETRWIAPLAISFLASLVGCYGGRVMNRDIERNASLTFGYFMFTAWFGLVGGLLGAVLGSFLLQGVLRVGDAL